MSSYFQEGDVVICSTGQAGTVVQLASNQAWVLLANGDFWIGMPNSLRKPQDAEDLALCTLDVDRFAAR